MSTFRQVYLFICLFVCFPVTRKKEQHAVLKRRIIAWREERKGSERWSTGEGGVEGTVLLYFLLQDLSTGLYLSSSAGELAITSNPRSKTVVVGSSSLVSGLNMFLVTATRYCVPPPHPPRLGGRLLSLSKT